MLVLAYHYDCGGVSMLTDVGYRLDNPVVGFGVREGQWIFSSPACCVHFYCKLHPEFCPVGTEIEKGRRIDMNFYFMFILFL